MRVLMVDDHMMFLQGLKTLLNVLAPELNVDTAARLADGLQMASATAYDLVLLDWHLGEESAENDGAESMRRLREVGCAARIVVLSGETKPSLIRQTIEAGAAGFIPKKYSSEVMLAALNVVVSGGIFLPPEALNDESTGAATRTRRSTDALVDVESRFVGLTPRQVEVYRAAARGLPNKLIARELDISESTVKTHLSAVYSVLGVSNRTQAAFQASREGFRVD
jgi:DNA-binding NarL/FixJ family response regulator